MTRADKELSCSDIRARMDLYQDALLDEGDTEALDAHLSSCQDCQSVLAGRKALRARIRNVVLNSDVPDDLGHRVQFAVATAGAPRRVVVGNFGKSMLAIAAALLITAGAFYFREDSDRSLRKETEQQFIARLSSGVVPIMRVGLQQHVHCGVFREYTAVAPALADIAREKTVSASLIEAVERHAPPGLHVVMAHQCTLHGRSYTHVIARGQGHLMSLLVTRRAAGESLPAQLKALQIEPDFPIFEELAKSGIDTYAIDAFETSEYLVFLVSDMPPAENLKTLRSMTTQVRAALL